MESSSKASDSKVWEPLIPSDLAPSTDDAAEIERLTAKLARDHDPKHYYPRSHAFRMLGQYDQAIRDRLAYMAHHKQGNTDFDYTFLASCHWLLDDPDNTIKALNAAEAAQYTDISGGVRPPALLLYVALRLDDLALQKRALTTLRKFSRRLPRPWPWPVALYLL